MCFFVSLIPATFFVVIGYFVLFSSTKTQGGVQKFGRILAIWIFVIASFLPLAGLYATLSGACPSASEHFEKMRGEMSRPAEPGVK